MYRGTKEIGIVRKGRIEITTCSMKDGDFPGERGKNSQRGAAWS
jgi:hypothetical protein